MNELEGSEKIYKARSKFQFVASLWTASAVLYFYMSLLYSFLSDGLVDISL